MGQMINRRRVTGWDNSYDAEVQYLETDGASYFDTNIAGSSNIKFDITFVITTPTQDAGYLFGMDQMYYRSEGIRFWHFGAHTPATNGSMPSGWVELKNTVLSNQLTVFPRLMQSYEVVANNATFTSNNTFYILATNMGSTVSYSGKGTRIISAKIYRDDILLLDLIPVRKNGKGFLFDRLHQKLFAKKGNGNISIGPDIPNIDEMVRVEYLESDGYQFIDLGIYPSLNTIAKIKFMNLAPTGSVIFGMDDGEYRSYRYFNASNNTYFDTGSGNTNGRLNSWTLKINTDTIYEIELGNKYVKDLIGDVTIQGTKYDYNYRFPLTLNGNTTPSKNRWYSVKIYNGDALIMDGVPVRIGNIGYLYDYVSNKILIHHGIGEFILGPDENLPLGYNKLSELSVTNDESLWVKTDIPFTSGEWRFVFTAKYYSISTSQRQLCGWEFDPWFGCDKGEWNFSGTLISTNIPKGTQLAIDTWYNFDLTVTQTKIQNSTLGIFRCSNPTYQSHMSIRSFKAYLDDVLVGDFVPCENPDNEKGLYNLVTNVFSKLQ